MRKKISMLILVLITSSTIGIGFGQGCAKSQKSSDNPTTSNEPPVTPEAANTDKGMDPNSSTLSVVYNKQVLDHMVSCTGVSVPSDETLATWSSKRGAVSIDGTVLTITSPMLMAVTTISGDVCRDLINQEKISPRLFNNVNWSGTTLPSNAALSDAIRGLALSCWQRSEADPERQVIMDGLNSEFGTGQINTSDAFLFLCTSMLSSLDTLTL